MSLVTTKQNPHSYALPFFTRWRQKEGKLWSIFSNRQGGLQNTCTGKTWTSLNQSFNYHTHGKYHHGIPVLPWPRPPNVIFWFLQRARSTSRHDIKQVHKGGRSRSQPVDYRPVSLTNHIGKTLERIIRKTLVSYLENHSKMDQNRHGSRSGRSILTQLIEHHDEVLRMLEEGEMLIVST